MRGFIEELRHRNVFRVGIAYVIAAWLFVQAADIATESFAAPEWVMRILIIFLLVGLPIALFLAWAFELTPDGVVKAEDVPEDAPKDPRSGRRLNRITLVALVAAVAWIGWDAAEDRSEDAAVPFATVADKSIAVLPFADFSPDGDQAWFADGLTDEILNALARTRDLRVASRTSSFAHKGSEESAPSIAAALGVAHILEGSVRRAGDRIRVTAQLIRASDDAHLWSDTFDGSSEDSIEIQETIAFEIASVLDTALDPEELRRMVAAGTDSIRAWELYLQIRELQVQASSNFDSQYGNDRIIGLYEEIIAADPSFADAHFAFAQIVLSWLDFATIATAPTGYSVEDVQQLFAEASGEATEHARSEEARLNVEALRARVQLRLTDLVKITERLFELKPEGRTDWRHLEALLLTSDFDAARSHVLRTAASVGPDDDAGSFFALAARVDLPAGVAGAERLLSRSSPTESHYYQAHRIFLYDDRIEEAAELARRFIAAATSPTWALMVRIRQACAEGRVSDAEQYYSDYAFPSSLEGGSNIHWLALQTLGRKAEAEALVRPLDTPGRLFTLSGLLSYTHFDPRPFPNLSAVLEAQGVQRQSTVELSFACKRDGD